MSFFIDRIREPSTWAGIAVLLSTGAQALATGDAGTIGAVVGGLAAMLIPERSKK